MMDDEGLMDHGEGNNLLTRLGQGDRDVFQTSEQRRTELLADVVAAAWGTHGDFIDADQFLTKPTVLRRLASILAARIPHGVDRLIGRDPHSLVLGAAVALETGIPLVVARTTQDGESALSLHGELHPRERALVVEGVTGTGASAAEAVNAVRAQGAAVVGVLIAVDRGQGAIERLGQLGITLDILFDDDELRDHATRGLSS